MLEGIGRIHDYVRQKNLRLMANRRIATGQTVDLNRSQGNGLFSTSHRAASAKKSTPPDKVRMAAIKQKLKNGDKLSDNDMQYLKEAAPSLYRKAKAIQSAREELARDLKQVRSKEEARLAMVRAAMRVSGAAAMADCEIGAGAGVAPGAFAAGAAPSAGGESGMNGMAAAPAGLMAATGGETAAADGAPLADVKPEAAGADEVSAMAAIGDILAQAADENREAADGLEKFMRKSAPTEDDETLPPTAILIIRALQKKWLSYVKSDAYKALPQTLCQAGRENGKLSPAWRQRCLTAAQSYR